MTTTTHPDLTPEQIETLGRELDELRNRVRADLGERDAVYIRRMIKAQRALELTGRGLLFVGALPPAWLGGVAALSLSKILDNMEIGHNVMHGQYDWMKDPALDSKRFEWDTACPGDQWRHSHNYMHHTHTNVLGKDRDIGYGILRIDPEQPWRPWMLGQPLYFVALALAFEYGIGFHDVESDLASGEAITWAQAAPKVRETLTKIRDQVLKDYVAFPALSLPFGLPGVVAAAGGALTANVVRNLWSFTVIFCGHFPDDVVLFDAEAAVAETRSDWYRRQILGSANFEGGPMMHLMTGNLDFQIEHHLFPDVPSNRYAEMAPRVREICERHGVPYNTGSFMGQFGTVVRKVLRLALPGPFRR